MGVVEGIARSGGPSRGAVGELVGVGGGVSRHPRRGSGTAIPERGVN